MRRASPGLSSIRRTPWPGSSAFKSARGKGDHGEPEAVDRLHHDDELVEVDGLGDVAVGVQVVALQHVLFRLGGGEDHHRDLAQVVVALDLREHLAPVLLRQVQVEQDDVGARRLGVLALALEEIDRLDAVLRPVQVVVDLAFLECFLGEAVVAGLSSTSRISTGSPALRIMALFLWLARDGETERASAARLRLDPDAAAVPVDDLLADREPDAGAGILRLVVQPLEHHEDAVGILGVRGRCRCPSREHPDLVRVSPSTRIAGGSAPRNLIALPTGSGRAA
jgi:hypothetical protein